MSIFLSSDDDSDGIEVVEKEVVGPSRAGNNDICQLCSTSLHGLGNDERTDHYNEHQSGSRTSKRGRPKPVPVATSQRKTTPMKFKGCARKVRQEDVFWYPARAEEPPDNYSPGVLSILKEALKQSHKKGATQRAVLCYERTPHIHRESFDLNWGCGYRNFLMACAALMDQQTQTLYFACLNDPLPPGIRNLQRWLEDAWGHGYDDIGAHDFEYKLIDTNNKLGTGDLYVAFTSRKIPCVLVDFNLKNSSKGFDGLTEWIVNYFTEKPKGDINKILRAASPVVATGYELAKDGKYNLLVFDPSSNVDKGIRQAALNVSTSADWASSSASLGKSKRRDQPKSPAPNKRSRTTQDPDDRIVSIPDTDDEIENARRAVALESTLDPDTVIKAFRLNALKKKKHDYQLLYFTMGDLLTDEEQNDRKVVLSVVEC